MGIRLGYSSSNISLNLNSGKMLRGKEVAPEKTLARLRTNLDATYRILNWNNAIGFKLFRVGLWFHPRFSDYTFEQQKATFNKVSGLLADMRIFAEDCGMRLTMHAIGSLGSPYGDTADKAIAQLKYCNLVLEHICPKDGIVVIHLGGVFNGKEATAKRIQKLLAKMPGYIKDRIAFENDELWTPEETYALSELTGVNFVYDIHHHRLNPGGKGFSDSTIQDFVYLGMRRARSTGKTQKVHISSSADNDNTSKHADYVEYVDYARLRKAMHVIGVVDCDIMVEAGKKEQAVLELRNSCTAHYPVWSSLENRFYV
jgi:UV DNA damage endonuclease